MSHNQYFIHVLKQTALFSNLTDEQLEFIIASANLIELAEGMLLFRKGDPSDSLYVVLKGQLSATLTTETGEVKSIGLIQEGETVGELGVLSSKSRASTVYTASQVQLLHFPKDAFINITKQYPSVMSSMIQFLVSRSQGLIEQLDDTQKNNYTLVVYNEYTPQIEHFVAKLKGHSSNNLGIYCIEESHAELNHTIRESMNDHSAHHHHLLYFINHHNSTWVEACLKKINSIYVISQHHDDEKKLMASLEKILQQDTKRQKIEIYLIRIHNTGSVAHQEASLTHNQFARAHHVRLDFDADYQRILRYISGTPVGLVLGGGGVKGWAHFGVIKALKELSIPIDMIGGSSSGAIAAACYAASENEQEAMDRFVHVMKHIRSPMKIKNLTWPIISLFSGKTGTNAIKKVFETKCIEDLLIPFFCISANLSNREETVHLKGVLWERIRASIAIPGILPPVVLDHMIHVDGGVVNNLPVDRMRLLLGKNSKIISVTLNKTQQVEKYSFPPILTPLEMFKYKIGWSQKKYKFPTFSNCFLQALLMGSLAKELRNRQESDILIAPDASGYNMLGISELEEQQLMQLGYNEAIYTLSQASHIKSSI